MDHYIVFAFSADYSFKDYLKLILGYDLAYNNTAALLNGTTGLFPANYTKHEIYLRLSFAY